MLVGTAVWVVWLQKVADYAESTPTMKRNFSSASTIAGKHMLPSISERPSKRTKLESDVGNRKEFLYSLRAICDRWAVHVKMDGEGVADGLEVLRRFLRDMLPPKGKKFPLQEYP